MKILQIYELGPLDSKSVCNGIDVAILELSRELCGLGHEVTILTGAGANGDCAREIDGIKIIPTDFAKIMKRTWDPVNLKLARQAAFPLISLREELGGYGIYHGHIYTSGLLAAYLARKNDAMSVNTIHGSYYDIWEEIASFPSAQFYRAGERFLAPLIARLCDLQIHTGGYFAKKVVEWGVPADKVKVIHNGTSAEAFGPEVMPADFEKDGPIIFTARRLVRKNGLGFLLEAMSIVLKEKKCRLLIAGDGPEMERLVSFAKNLGISNNVTFLGMLPHGQIPPYLALCDFAVVPSLMEASSLFVLEAMAMRKPVIATNAGGIPEIMKNGSGVLVNPSDAEALAEEMLLLLDPQERKKFSGNGGKEASNLTWKEVAKKTEKEYLRILG